MVLPFQMRMRMEELDPKSVGTIARADFWIAMFDPYMTPSVEGFHRSWVWQWVNEGRLLLHYDDVQKAKYASTYAFETVLYLNLYGEKRIGWPAEKLKAIAVNLGHTNSKVFDSVYKRECSTCGSSGEVKDQTADHTYIMCPNCGHRGYIEPYDLMITFVRRKDKLWNVSLYSTKDHIDCGSIAKSFGGGGHKGAAGFQCKDLPFNY